MVFRYIITKAIKYVPFCIKTYLLKKIPSLIPPLLMGMPTCCDERQHGERQEDQIVLNVIRKNATCLIVGIIVKITANGIRPFKLIYTPLLNGKVLNGCMTFQESLLLL